MSIRKTLGILMAFVSFTSIAVGGLSQTPSSDHNKVESHISTLLTNRKNKANLNESAPEINRDVFSVKVRSATVTPKAKSFEFVFDSVQVKTFTSNTRSFFVAIDDESYTGDPNDYKKPEEGVETPVFNGYIYRIEAGSSGGDIYIPSTFKYGSKFVVNVSTIGAYCAVDYTGINNIFIPDSMETIQADAFVNVPETVNIKCVSESAGNNWDENWTDSTNVSYGVSLTAKEKGNFDAKYSAGGDQSFGHAKDFVVGTKELPLTLTYDLVEGSSKTTKVVEIPLSSDLNSFDGVGGLIGTISLTKTVDIELSGSQDVDPESFVFYNIYSVKCNEDADGNATSIVFDASGNPALDVEYKASAVKSFTSEINISDIISFAFYRVASFNGYTTISMKVSTYKDCYKELMPSVFKSNASLIDSGKYRIRFAFYNMTSASYNLTYKNGAGEIVNKSVVVTTPVSAFELSKEKDNIVSFLIKDSTVGDDFEASNLVAFDLVGSSVNVHLWDTENNNKLGRSEYCKRFGHITVLSENDAFNLFNINVFLIVFFASFTVAFAACAVALYFFLKNKYKNDEFRRMKTKPYVKKSVIGFFGAAIVCLATLFIIFRTSVFKNSVAVYNPTDVFIVLAGLVSLVIIGLFIRFIVITAKANKQRRIAIKLKLNEDVADDGTN